MQSGDEYVQCGIAELFSGYAFQHDIKITMEDSSDVQFLHRAIAAFKAYIDQAQGDDGITSFDRGFVNNKTANNNSEHTKLYVSLVV